MDAEYLDLTKPVTEEERAEIHARLEAVIQRVDSQAVVEE